MVVFVTVGIMAHAGVILSTIFFALAAVLFYSASKSGLVQLLNTQEKMLTILIETCEILFIVSLFMIFFQITGNTLFNTLAHIGLYSTSLLLCLATFFDYRERKAQAIKDSKEVAARRKKHAALKKQSKASEGRK